MSAAEQTRKDIAAARRKGFKPGTSYWRGATLMVEITPGNFVNADKAKEFGVRPRETEISQPAGSRRNLEA